MSNIYISFTTVEIIIAILQKCVFINYYVFIKVYTNLRANKDEESGGMKKKEDYREIR